MLNTPFSPWPSYTNEEISAVQRVLLSNQVNYWTGHEGHSFEQEFATWSQSRYAVALANGTAALELALRAVGIGVGDEVIVTPRTFLASASSIVLVGGKPVFADVHPDSQNITVETIEKVVTQKTRALVCVHLAGWPCAMDEIMDFARSRDLFVIEDCAQAHGATYNGRSVGSLGHLAAWSFCQDKIMTTGGEGGMLTTNDESYWRWSWAYKDHGKNYDAVFNRDHKPGFQWVHESFGTNWRMTEIQAVIGRIQLQRMENWHSKRIEHAKTIWNRARNLSGLHVPTIPDNIEHAAYKCYVFVDHALLKNNWDRDRIIKEINEAGVPCYTGSCSEVYLEKAFDATGYRPAQRLPVAKLLGETSMMFLVHPTLTCDEIDKTCDVLEMVMRRAVL